MRAGRGERDTRRRTKEFRRAQDQPGAAVLTELLAREINAPPAQCHDEEGAEEDALDGLEYVLFGFLEKSRVRRFSRKVARARAPRP